MPIAWAPDQWPMHPPLAAFRKARVQTAADARSEDAIRRARLVYYAMCSFVDELIGDALGALGDAGLTDDTRVVYTSDHGETLGDYGLWGKSVMYDSAAGVPLILAGPDVPAGRSVDCPVSLVDLAPSIMAGTGVELEVEDEDLPGNRSLANSRRRRARRPHGLQRIPRHRLDVRHLHAARPALEVRPLRRTRSTNFRHATCRPTPTS